MHSLIHLKFPRLEQSLLGLERVEANFDLHRITSYVNTTEISFVPTTVSLWVLDPSSEGGSVSLFSRQVPLPQTV